MTLLPDIVREAKIVSGKDNKVINDLLPSTSITAFDLSLDGNNNEERPKRSKKRQNSIKNNDQQHPNLIYNDKMRSSSYARVTRSTDFINVKNSPLATSYIYNWKPVERLPTKVVQSKVKIYKPPKRIEMTGRPSSPFRVKVDYETTDSSYHNEKRSLDMKRLQYLQSHTAWSIYPYAAVDEREEYKYFI